MHAVSYSDLRQNLKTCLDRVCQDHDPLIVTRKNGRNVVILSMDEYTSLLETRYLQSTPANTEHLRLSLEQLNSGKTSSRELPGDAYAVHR